MDGIPSGAGGGGGASSSATSGNTLGNDVYNYGVAIPSAPPGMSQPAWLIPAIIGGVGLLLAVILFFRKK